MYKKDKIELRKDQERGTFTKFWKILTWDNEFQVLNNITDNRHNLSFTVNVSEA